MTNQECKAALARLPPLPESAQTVVCHLDGNEPMTSKQLREATGLPRRTLYTALQRLKEAGALHERASLRDSRQSYYWLRSAEERPPRPIQRHAYATWAERAMAVAES